MSSRLSSWLLLTLLLLGLSSVSACRDTGREGEFFEIAGKLFVFNYRVATATYLVNLVPLQPVEEGQTAVATFEDPAGGSDIVVRQKIWPKLPKTVIESPPLRCVAKNRPYKVSIRIETADGTVRQVRTRAEAYGAQQSRLTEAREADRALLGELTHLLADCPAGHLDSLASRIDDATPTLVISADAGSRRIRSSVIWCRCRRTTSNRKPWNRKLSPTSGIRRAS